ncbi:hypothetical protein ACLOJK_016885 [Asimina triloba]
MGVHTWEFFRRKPSCHLLTCRILRPRPSCHRAYHRWDGTRQKLETWLHRLRPLSHSPPTSIPLAFSRYPFQPLSLSLSPTFLSLAISLSDVSSSRHLSLRPLSVSLSLPWILRCYGDELMTEGGGQLYNIFLKYIPGGTLADGVRS